MSDRAVAACFTAVGTILIAVAVAGWNNEGFSSQRITYNDGKLSEPIELGSVVEVQFEGFKPGDLYLASVALNGRMQETSAGDGGLGVVHELRYDYNRVLVLRGLRPGTLCLLLTPLTITERGHEMGTPIVIVQVLE